MAQLKSFFLKIFKRALSYFRAFKEFDNILFWRIHKYKCCYCGFNYHINLKKKNRDHSSKSFSGFSVRCLNCHSNLINTSIIEVVKKYVKTSRIEIKCWEMSSYGATFNYLKRNFKEFVFSEYFEGVDSGKIINKILAQDVQNTSFKKNQFNLITSNQVFEHVPDLDKAFSECSRILCKGGALIFTVPLFSDILQTKKVCVLNKGKLHFLYKPEFHSSRIMGGKKNVPVFWHISRHDICDLLKKHGFKANVVEVGRKNFAISEVIYALKTN